MKITQESCYLIKKLTDTNSPFKIGDIVIDNGSIGVTLAINEEFYTCTVLWLQYKLNFEIKTQYISTSARELKVKWSVVDTQV